MAEFAEIGVMQKRSTTKLFSQIFERLDFQEDIHARELLQQVTIVVIVEIILADVILIIVSFNLVNLSSTFIFIEIQLPTQTSAIYCCQINFQVSCFKLARENTQEMREDIEWIQKIIGAQSCGDMKKTAHTRQQMRKRSERQSVFQVSLLGGTVNIFWSLAHNNVALCTRFFVCAARCDPNALALIFTPKQFRRHCKYAECREEGGERETRSSITHFILFGMSLIILS